MNNLTVVLLLLCLAGVGAFAFFWNNPAPIILDDSNLVVNQTHIHIEGNTDLNSYWNQTKGDANVNLIIASRMPITDDNLNVPNVWSAIDGNKGVGFVDLNGYWDKSKGDENVNIAIKQAIDSNYFNDHNLSNAIIISFSSEIVASFGQSIRTTGIANEWAIDHNGYIKLLDFSRIGRPTKATFWIVYSNISGTGTDYNSGVGIGFSDTWKGAHELDTPIPSSVIYLQKADQNKKNILIDLDISELPTTQKYVFIDTNTSPSLTSLRVGFDKVMLVLYGLPDMNNANYLGGLPATDYALKTDLGVGIDLNGYIDKPKFDGNFWLNILSWLPVSDVNLNIPNVWAAIDGNRISTDLNAYLNKLKFDENFNSALASRMPISDANLNVPNVWLAIDGNRIANVDLNKYWDNVKGDANVNFLIKTQLDSNGFLRNNIFPITDANLSIPNVWSAIDGNKTLTDLNGYMNKTKFDANFAVAFDINFVNRFDGNFNSRFKTQYDNNATQRQSDTNRMIQQAIDLNGWITSATFNSLFKFQYDNNQTKREQDTNSLIQRAIDANGFATVSGINLAIKTQMDSNSLGIDANINSKIKTQMDSNNQAIDANINSKLKTQMDSNNLAIDANINNKIKTQYDANAVQRQSDANKMIQQAIDKNNWVRWIDGNAVYGRLGLENIWIQKNWFLDVNARDINSFNINVEKDLNVSGNIYANQNDGSYNKGYGFFKTLLVGTTSTSGTTIGDVWATRLYGTFFGSLQGNANTATSATTATTAGSANYASTSGDADTLDTYHASSFPLLSSSNTFTGAVNIFKDVNARDINASRDLNIWGKFRVVGTSNFSGAMTAGTISGGAISGSSLSSSGNITSSGAGTIGTGGAINAGTSMSSGGNIDAASYSVSSVGGLSTTIYVCMNAGCDTCYITYTSGLMTDTSCPT